MSFTITELVIEASIQNPTVALDFILFSMIDYRLTHGPEARYVFRQNNPILTFIRNVNTDNALLSLDITLPSPSSFYESQKDVLEKLIKQATIKREKDLKDLQAQPTKLALYNKLLDQFELPISTAIELVKKLNPLEVKVLKRITKDQMNTLEDIIQKIMFSSVSVDCHTFADAQKYLHTYEEAITEIERILAGKSPTLLVYTAHESFNTGFELIKQLTTEVFNHDIAEIIESTGITADHLKFISPKFKDAVLTDIIAARDAKKPRVATENSGGGIIYYKEADISRLDKAKDYAMQLLTDAGFSCPEVAHAMDYITQPENRFRDTIASNKDIDEKIKLLQEYVSHKISERKVELAARKAQEIADHEADVTAELETKGAKRHLLAINTLQTNAASPRYSSLFSSTIQLLTSVIDYVNTQEMQALLIAYFANHSFPSIASSVFGFFDASAGSSVNLLEAAANNQTSLSFR
jgi:hypothetical protein